MDKRLSSLQFLQAVYWNEELPLSVRMRAAMAAIPFEHPKLVAVANVDGNSFAAILERRYLHMRKMQSELIEAKPVEPKPQPTVGIKPYLPTVPDRRYRRI
jgi:hypothetical protein